MGIVEFRGVQYQGSHTPLVSPETFFKVQEVLAAHNTAGDRSWRHQHYLKGSIFCSVCEARLTLDYTNGNGGRYCYFVCLGRKRGVNCDWRALQADAIEDGPGQALADGSSAGRPQGSHPAHPGRGPGGGASGG